MMKRTDSSVQSVTTIHGSHFDAGVVEPRPDAPQTAPPQTKPKRDYDRLLFDFKTDDPELRATFVSLRDTYIWALRELDKIFDEQDVRAQAAMTAKHEILKARVLELRQEKADTENQMRVLQNEWEQAKSRTQSAFNELQNAERDLGQMSRYAPAKAVEAARAAIATAREKFAKAQLAEADPYTAYIHLNTLTLPKLSEELRKAEAEELDLELLLSGRHATNSLGIHV